MREIAGLNYSEILSLLSEEIFLKVTVKKIKIGFEWQTSYAKYQQDTSSFYYVCARTPPVLCYILRIGLEALKPRI